LAPDGNRAPKDQEIFGKQIPMVDSNEVLIVGLPQMLMRLWHQLKQRRKKQFIAIVSLVLVSALAEVVSLGAILPFLGVLTAPDRVLRYPVIRHLMSLLGVISPGQLVLVLAMGFATAAVVAGVLRVLLLWASTRVAYATGADFSSDVYRRTLYQPYQIQVIRNSSDLISGITGKLSDTVNTLNQLLTLLSSSVLLVFIVSALFAIDPTVAAIAMVGFGGAYAVITAVSRRRLRLYGQRIAAEHTQVVKALQEGLGGIRDVLLDGTQPVYCDIYRKADYGMRRAYGNIIFASQSPRFAMEALGMVLIAALAYGISRTSGGVASALPVLGALALGAQRLLPVLQQAYSAWATIVGNQMSLASTLSLLEQPLPPEALLPAPAPLLLRDCARFNAVWFRYANSGPWVLSNLNLTIRKGTRMGFVGSTGSGKSTALDVLMGLLAPTQGELLVDGEPVVGNRVRAWQRAIAHVPQSIFLADTSLAENIAFGIPRSAIDMVRVKQAARQAQIADFIEARPEGYDAWVGERGIRLSGGQRQRIGIARALYKRASVLIFDEATSALDNATEQSVMDAIDGLDRELTILLIAHRLTTVRRCDVIVELEHGRVVSQGTYDELLESSASFRHMVRTVA
jgi:ABC-type multidrug transport system fused ATPase/permease subunit